MVNIKCDGEGKYYKDGQLIYDGEVEYNMRNGEGKEYIDGQLIYEGKWLNNMMNGKLKCLWVNTFIK